MSAEMLRRAAALMRERAEMAAIPSGAGDWFVRPADDNQFATVRSSGGEVARGMADDEAEHVASWHPAVALAVADWLEAEAESHRADLVGPYPSGCCRMSQALAAARAYLGEQS